MALFAVISSFLIFFGITSYVLIVLSDIFQIPVCYAPFTALALMLLQAIFFPRVILSIIKKAVSNGFQGSDANYKNIRLMTLKSRMPIMFSLQGIFFKNTIVASERLSEILSEDEIEWLMRRESARAASGANLLFMSSGLVPFVLHHLSALIRKLGESNRAFGGSESILSFGGMMRLVAKGAYLLMYLPSRELSIFFDRKEGVMPKGLIDKVCAPRENDDKNMLSFWESVSYLSFSAPKDSTAERTAHFKTVWQSRYLMFRPVMPPLFRQSEAGIQRSDRSSIRQMTAEAAAGFLIFISFTLMTVGINAGIPLSMLSILLIAIHLTQRPLTGKKTNSSEGMHISPTEGRMFAGSGRLSYDSEKGYCISGIPLYFYELSPVALPSKAEQEEVQVSGWIRKSDRTFIEVSALYIGGRQAYRSDRAFWFIAADIMLLIGGILMLL
ncbi:MAG: hypothetical protein MJ234_04845 [bacterium]|nr:hypothetical protein [bacterium]